MVVMGQVIAPYGVKGWIKIRTFTESIDSLSQYPSWWVSQESDWTEMRVLEARPHNDVLLARLENCDNRNMAELLNGHEIGVPRSALPQSQDGEYYWVDLIGLQVVNRQNVAMGEVTGLLQTGANNVLKVTGERERLIPIVDDVLVEVDLKQRRITVDWDADF